MITITVNGEPRQVTAEPTVRLVEVLRDELGLPGTRFGCGHGECGACTVIIAGQAVRSCQISLQEVAGREIVTIEGVGSPERPHPLQAAVSNAQAFQCGHCASGMIMEAKALWDSTPRPTEAQVRKAMDGHQCMCGSHGQVVRAVLRVLATEPRP
jgi:nicotinate dehydrogenase subunit A